MKLLSLKSIRPFWKFFIGSWMLYTGLMTMSLSFRLYEYFPAYSFIGYSVVIISQLIAMHYTVKRYDYMLLGISLIVIGAIASLDMIINKDQFVGLWMQWKWLPLTPDHVDGYIQILLILLNIFTGSIAAQCLFYSSNEKHF